MFRQYRPFENGEHIVVGADTSAGLSDYCAAQFLSKTKIDVPLVYHEKVTGSIMVPYLHNVLESIHWVTGVKPTVAIERNFGGYELMDRLGTLNREGKYILYRMQTSGTTDDGATTKYGWDTNTATRPAMLEALKNAVDNRALTLYDKPTIEELYSFVKVRTTTLVKAQAEVGAFDDLVMSLAIAWQLSQQVQAPPKPYVVPRDDISRKDWSFG
jgi:hypothetical protein